MMRRILVLLLCLIAWPSTLLASSEGLRVHFLGDPQIGYGGTWEDYHRLKLVVDAVNHRSSDVVIVAGDLVQSRSPLETWLFDRALGKIKAKVLLTPGNHDVVDVPSLKRYRERYGRDYYLETQGTVSFLIINSETARSSAISQEEFEAQWAFINNTFSSAAHDQKLVVVTHRPPYVSDETEPDSDEAWPAASRNRLLSLCRAHGSCLILAGHLHRTHSTQSADGIEVRVLPGSARSFDHSPVGYEEISLSGSAHQTQFHRVAPPPSAPPSIPGLREWTPRLFVFSAGHWLMTVLYLSVAYLCRQAHRRSRRRNLWLPIAWVLLFFAVNMQLDFDEFLRETGRILARLTGVSAIRHLITAGGLALVAALGLWRLNRHRKHGIPGEELLAALSLCIPIAWFMLSTISHHDIRMLFDEFTWDILTLSALLSIALLSLNNRRTANSR